MDAVNRNIHLLLNSIQKSDVYRTYKKQEAILEKNPELVSRVQHFRSDNFRLQNEERGNLLQDAEQLARESAELRRNPEVNAYLDAELALCRMMQQICKTLTDGIEMMRYNQYTERSRYGRYQRPGRCGWSDRCRRIF